MRYSIRVAVGSLISVMCLGLALYALYQLVRGGSCASGGVHVSARQCPPGTETWAWVLPGAIVGGLLAFFLGTVKGIGPAPQDPAGPGPAGLGHHVPGGQARPARPFAGPAIVVRGQVISGERPSGASPDGRDPLDRLRKLQALLDAGTVSPAEFEAAKARILAEM
ncbi:SHOCT domain-containing protein [Sphaerisporangium rhizosphaerae]|uniref:SHOCT domain-containing protein n=1 Tax=Sphaerisporangium rhizosphaerae TaxID=2269375 RepID=A0ABW2P4G9_9ACTN